MPESMNTSIRALVSNQKMTAPLTRQHSENVAGFTVFELLIVVAMITVISGFVVIQVVRARQAMMRDNAAQEMMGYLEKARVDSVRRRPAAAAEMAQVTILNATFYSVTIDSTGDGTLDAPQIFSLPTGANLDFQPPYPRTIYFNWRGRTVDAAGNLANPSYVRIRSSGNQSTQIDLTTAGQTSLDGPPPSSAVVNSNAPAPTLRQNTQVP